MQGGLASAFTEIRKCEITVSSALVIFRNMGSQSGHLHSSALLGDVSSVGPCLYIVYIGYIRNSGYRGLYKGASGLDWLVFPFLRAHALQFSSK